MGMCAPKWAQAVIEIRISHLVCPGGFQKTWFFPKACHQSQVSHVEPDRLLLVHTLRAELRPPVEPDGTRGTGWGHHEMVEKGAKGNFSRDEWKPKTGWIPI